MGIFDFFKKKPEAKPSVDKEVMRILDKVDPNYRKDMEYLDYQNKLLSRVNSAREKYKIDKDLESAIKEYEFAFIESNPPCATSQDIDLAGLYIKAGEYNKAWAYLNQLILRRTSPDPDIRFYQARILKKEEKYAYAIEMYALGYYYKSIPNRPFPKEKFQKDIATSAKKLGWDQAKIDTITKIVMSYPHKDNSSESKLVRHIREFLQNGSV